MEESNTKDHLTIDVLLAILNIVKPGISLVSKGALQVGLDTSGRLSSELHSVLQDCNWEEIDWSRGQV